MSQSDLMSDSLIFLKSFLFLFYCFRKNVATSPNKFHSMKGIIMIATTQALRSQGIAEHKHSAQTVNRGLNWELPLGYTSVGHLSVSQFLSTKPN